MSVWARHTLATRYCAIASVGEHHCTTACGGSFDSVDAEEFAFAPSPAPMDRCAACVRELQRGRIETGLRELERVTR